MRLAHGDGKISVALGVRDWLALVLALVGVVTYVLRIETSVRSHEVFQTHQEALNTENAQSHEAIAKNVNENKWRIRRVERKLGIHHDEEDQ